MTLAENPHSLSDAEFASAFIWGGEGEGSTPLGWKDLVSVSGVEFVRYILYFEKSATRLYFVPTAFQLCFRICN
jgi:hypothetical protein